MTPREPELAAAGVSLATEAALLEARARMLQEALDTVDARIGELSETLRRLQDPTGSASSPGREARAVPRP